MRFQNKILWFLVAGMVVILLAVVLFTTVPGLQEVGQGKIEAAISALQRGNQQNIDVTSSPFSLPDYMWDIKVGDSYDTDLRALVPAIAQSVAGILDQSGIRLKVGQDGSPYDFELKWDSGSGDTQIEFTLFDRLQRPVDHWAGAVGNHHIIIPGGMYKLTLSSQGTLTSDFELTARARRSTEKAGFEVPGTGGIPTINIQMSDAMLQSWDIQRAALLAKLETQSIVDTSNFKRVLADLVTDEGKSVAQLWDAGVLNPVHFSPDTPSFTGKIVSGPLLFGMSQFKLYSIKTQEGVLNQVVFSILYDEGLFVPRSMLVNIQLHNEGLGLYLLIETPDSIGFFAGVDRYDGQIFGQGTIYKNPSPPDGLTEWLPVSIEEEFSGDFSQRANQTKFAKELAFITCLHATHSTSGVDFRLYRHPYLDSPEVVIRDPDADVLPVKEMLLTHTSWWLGPLLRGRGAVFNPKVFPQDERLPEYAVTAGAFQFRSVQQTVPQFVKLPENRELFDRYLCYASDGAFQRRLVSRMESAVQAAYPFLSEASLPVIPWSAQPYDNWDSELSWVNYYLNAIIAGDPVVPRTIPALAKQSALLVSIDPQEATSASDTTTISLYNLSPFSARLKLPEYAHPADNSIATTLGNDVDGWYLAPSLLFPTVIPLTTTEANVEPNSFPLNREAAQRLLALERLRFGPHPDAANTLVPFVDVQIPDEQLNDFIKFISENSLVTLAGTYAVSSNKNILVNELPEQDVSLESAPTTPVNNLETPPPDIVILPLSLESVATGQRLSLLISNFSGEAISLDLASLQWKDPEQSQVLSTIHGIWILGKQPDQTESSYITLGASRLPTGSGQDFQSPMLWTGALQSFLSGSVDATQPNCALVEFDLDNNQPRWIHTDANEFAKSASADGAPKKVIVQEQYELYLPARMPKTPLDPGYLSPPTETTVTASSSHLSHNFKNLIDGDVVTFWHVEFPTKSSEHWVTFDFIRPVTVEKLAILPRCGFTGQFWDRDNAIWQGSNNRSDWTNIITLAADKTTMAAAVWDWLRYSVADAQPYRYYRLLINDPDFLSIAEIKFQVPEWSKPPVSVTDLIARGVFKKDSSPDSTTRLVRLQDKNTIISDMVIIEPGYVFEIEAGSTLSFTQGAGILSYSPIRALGTEAQPITLSPAEGSLGWKGIAVVGALGSSQFNYVNVDRATGGWFGDAQFSGGLTFMNTSATIAHTELADFASEDSLHLSGGVDFEITDLNIIRAKSDALDVDWGYGTITESSFLQAGGDGVDLSGSFVTISDSLMEGCADKGISIGEGSVVQINAIRSRGNRIGIAVKDQSIVRVEDSEFSENEYGLLRYIKKPVFIYPELFLANNTFTNNNTQIYEEPPDSWTRRFD